MDRTLTRILLARSNAESSTPVNSDNHDVDGFCRWSMPEVETLRASSTECELATREMVETTRPAACRHNNPVGPMSLSYSDLIEGGCVSRRTFCYVPDNGAYTAFKTAVRVNLGKQRRHYGLGRRGMTKSTQGGGATYRQSSCDDRLNTLTPGQDVQQQCSDRTNQTACNDNDPSKQQVMDDSQSHQCGRSSGSKGSRLSRGRRNNETMVTCFGDEVRTRLDQPRSDSRLIKTWLYAFLPPLVTTQLDYGDADPLRGKLADHGIPASKSRAASGRNRDRRSSDEQHPTVASRMVRTRLDDQTPTANRRQRKPQSTASDDAVDSHGEWGRQTLGLDQRSGRRCLDLPSDDSHVHFTDTSCDGPHHQEDDSDHKDTTALTCRSGEDQDGERDYKSNDDNSDDDDDDDGDDDDNDDKENEAVKSVLKSFNSRLSELEALQTREQLQLSLTGHVVDIHRRHQESCKS